MAHYNKPDEYQAPPAEQYTAEKQYSPAKEQYGPVKKQYSPATEQYDPSNHEGTNQYVSEDYREQYDQAEERYDDKHDSYQHHQSYYSGDYEPRPKGKLESQGVVQQMNHQHFKMVAHATLLQPTAQECGLLRRLQLEPSACPCARAVYALAK
jgi:hypothetical protein